VSGDILNFRGKDHKVMRVFFALDHDQEELGYNVRCIVTIKPLRE
jgi:hypothetical protein